MEFYDDKNVKQESIKAKEHQEVGIQEVKAENIYLGNSDESSESSESDSDDDDENNPFKKKKKVENDEKDLIEAVESSESEQEEKPFIIENEEEENSLEDILIIEENDEIAHKIIRKSTDDLIESLEKEQAIQKQSGNLDEYNEDTIMFNEDNLQISVTQRENEDLLRTDDFLKDNDDSKSIFYQQGRYNVKSKPKLEGINNKIPEKSPTLNNFLKSMKKLNESKDKNKFE